MAARRSLPDGVFGQAARRAAPRPRPAARRPPTPPATSRPCGSPARPPASPACRDSTATTNDSRCRPPSPAVQPHRDRVARPHALRRPRRALDVGRVDVAAAHDDHVLAPAADHDLAVGQVALVAGVEPAVGVLGGAPARRRSGSRASPTRRAAAAPRPRARRAPRRPSPTTRTSIPGSGGPSSGNRRAGPSPAGTARRCSSSCVGVDLVDLQPGVDRRERHPERGLGHPVRAQHRLRAQPEPGARPSVNAADGVRVDRLGAVQREAQRRQVQRAVVGPGQLAGQHGVGEVRRGGDGAAVPGDQLGPQQRAAEEVGRGDRDQLQAERPSARSGSRPCPCRGTAAATTPSRRGRGRAGPPPPSP